MEVLFLGPIFFFFFFNVLLLGLPSKPTIGTVEKTRTGLWSSFGICFYGVEFRNWNLWFPFNPLNGGDFDGKMEQSSSDW